MNLFKYFVIIASLIAIYSMIKAVISPIEKVVTIPLILFWALMALSWLGLIYLTIIMEKDWYKIHRNKGINKEK